MFIRIHTFKLWTPLQKANLLAKMRNYGKYCHNVKVLQEKKVTLIVAYRPKYDVDPEEYLPCSHCYAFYCKDDLYRQVHRCKLRPDVEDEDETCHQGPDQRWPKRQVKVVDFCQQGLEKLNDVVTKWYFRSTNFSKTALTRIIHKQYRLIRLQGKCQRALKFSMTCSACEKMGHNKRTCTYRQLI